MKQQTDVEDIKKKNNFISTHKSLGVGSGICHMLLAAVLQKTLPFRRILTKQWEPCLSAGAFRRQVARSATAADWAAPKISPDALMFVIMWIILCPASSLCKHRNYVWDFRSTA